MKYQRNASRLVASSPFGTITGTNAMGHLTTAIHSLSRRPKNGLGPAYPSERERQDYLQSIGHRKIPVQVTDHRDGSYRISFVPDAAGNLSVFIYVNNKPIKRELQSKCLAQQTQPVGKVSANGRPDVLSATAVSIPEDSHLTMSSAIATILNPEDIYAALQKMMSSEVRRMPLQYRQAKEALATLVEHLPEGTVASARYLYIRVSKTSAVIPSVRKYSIHLTADPTCPLCCNTDTALHRVISCVYADPIWQWCRVRVRKIIRDERGDVSDTHMLHCDFFTFPSVRRRAAAWYILHAIGFLVDHSKPVTVQDFIQLLRQDRWNAAQRVTLRKVFFMVILLLDIMPLQALHRNDIQPPQARHITTSSCHRPGIAIHRNDIQPSQARHCRPTVSRQFIFPSGRFRHKTAGLYWLAEDCRLAFNGPISAHLECKNVVFQGSPFQVCVRTLRPHPGTFHCCSFCSSHGNKEATCGCGGTMPGALLSLRTTRISHTTTSHYTYFPSHHTHPTFTSQLPPFQNTLHFASHPRPLA
ncbi:hypothetical protein PR048_005946 [Dryococelus australis]|uniref:Tick transposon n=1 Tax=Dryococelus australis TaxID=614101 RepID=A0ABQ9I9L8_9NEOP|nr:hypothetical protein PR048_005946 [Dryococelus australis]